MSMIEIQILETIFFKFAQVPGVKDGGSIGTISAYLHTDGDTTDNVADVLTESITATIRWQFTENEAENLRKASLLMKRREKMRLYYEANVSVFTRMFTPLWLFNVHYSVFSGSDTQQCFERYDYIDEEIQYGCRSVDDQVFLIFDNLQESTLFM